MTRPTLSEAKSWRPDSLRQAADAWDAAATDVHREFDVVVQGMHDTHDFWTGDAAEAARERAAQTGADASRLARALVAAAVAARDGAQVITAARDDVLGTVVAVQTMGFTVVDDRTVTPPNQAPPAVLATAGGNLQLAQEVLRSGAEEFTARSSRSSTHWAPRTTTPLATSTTPSTVSHQSPRSPPVWATTRWPTGRP